MTAAASAAGPASIPRGSWRLDGAWAMAIVVAAAAIAWQQRSLARLARVRPAGSPAGANLAVAQQRVGELERQLAQGPSPSTSHPAAAIMASAAVRQLQLRVESARSRESIRAAYGPLIHALALDPATADRLEGLLLRQRLAARDALSAAQAQGVRSIAGFTAAVQEAVSHEDEEIGALLAPTGFAQFEAYRGTLPEQQTVARLAARLASSATPLSDDQQAQLVQLIDRMEPPSYHQNQTFLSLIGMEDAPLTPAMVGAAPAILSPPQAAALQAVETAWMAKAQLQQALRARTPTGSPATSP